MIEITNLDEVVEFGENNNVAYITVSEFDAYIELYKQIIDCKIMDFENHDCWVYDYEMCGIEYLKDEFSRLQDGKRAIRVYKKPISGMLRISITSVSVEYTEMPKYHFVKNDYKVNLI